MYDLEDESSCVQQIDGRLKHTLKKVKGCHNCSFVFFFFLYLHVLTSVSSFTVKLLYAFSFCMFSGKLCCIKAAGRLVEESNGKQTSTRFPSFVVREETYAPWGKIVVKSVATPVSDELLEKVTLANNVCMSVLLLRRTSYCRMFLYILEVSVSCLSKAVRPPDSSLCFLVYLFLLKVEDCMSETCSSTKKNKQKLTTFFLKTNLLVWKKPDVCFPLPDLVYFDIPQRKTPAHWSKTLWTFIIRHVCASECKIVCLKEYVMSFF